MFLNVVLWQVGTLSGNITYLLVYLPKNKKYVFKKFFLLVIAGYDLFESNMQ